MVTVTEKASEVIQGILESENKLEHAVRLRVVTGGCSGNNYQFDIDETMSDQDTLAETANGVKVVVDPESMKLVDGITIDYVTNQLGGNFVFNNPQAKNSCGCGTSFSVE